MRASEGRPEMASISATLCRPVSRASRMKAMKMPMTRATVVLMMRMVDFDRSDGLTAATAESTISISVDSRPAWTPAVRRRWVRLS